MEYMNKGNAQGNMSPKLKDYQKKDSSYAEKQFGKTDDYISRKDAQEGKIASGLKGQAYKGRYS